MQRRELYDQCLKEFGLPLDRRPVYGSAPASEAERQAFAKYDQEAAALNKDYEQRIAQAVRSIRNDYQNKLRSQQAIALDLSRFSPVACYTYLISDMSGTGLAELQKYEDRAVRFQQQVETDVYDRFVERSYGGSVGGAYGWDEMLDRDKPIQIPTMDDFQHTTLAEALAARWVDLLLLALFSVVCFAGAFAAFKRYDVR